MAKLIYELSPFEARAIVECLDYLNQLQKDSLVISSEVDYSPDELDALIQVLKRQHPEAL